MLINSGVCIVPQLKKGQLVRVRQGVSGTRATTAEERNAWYARLRVDVLAGRDVPYDSAGESRLAPDTTDTDFSPGKCLTVTSARSSPRRIGRPWWVPPVGGYCTVLDTETGQEWLVAKRFLEVV